MWVMKNFEKENKFVFGLIKFFIFGVFLFGGFIVASTPNVAKAEEWVCGCNLATGGGCSTNVTQEFSLIASGEEDAAQQCKYVCTSKGCEHGTYHRIGWTEYACSCILIEDGKTYDGPISSLFAPDKQSSVDQCKEVCQTDPNYLTVSTLPKTEFDALRAIKRNYHCIRLDDDACMPISAPNDIEAMEQSKTLCKTIGAFITGPCPKTDSTDPGKSAKTLQEDAAKFLNPAGISQPTDLINKAIRMLMAFIGSISLVLYIYAGILWMTASGNTEKVTKAKTIILWTTLGVVVMLASYMLASVLFKSLGV